MEEHYRIMAMYVEYGAAKGSLAFLVKDNQSLEPRRKKQQCSLSVESRKETEMERLQCGRKRIVDLYQDAPKKDVIM